jgi:hypothetical protein
MNPWDAVALLVDRAPSTDALRAHGLQLLAAHRWRAVGRSVPDDLVAAERAAAIVSLAVPIVLERVRSAISGPVVLLKGPELAARYPSPVLRPFGDLDLLVADPASAHRALHAAGFLVDAGNAAARPHHRPPLRWPGLPLPVELHHAVRSPAWIRMPPQVDLVGIAEPGEVGVEGVLTLPPEHHALVVAAHAWAHGPLARFLDLVDIAVLLDGVERPRVAALAQSWGMNQLWAATLAVADAFFLPATPVHPALRLGAHHLWSTRERTVLEVHLARWLSGLAASTPAATLGATWSAVKSDLRTRPGEARRAKAARAARAVLDAFQPLSVHTKEV